MKNIKIAICLLAAFFFACAGRAAHDERLITVAVFSINDFHGAFVRNDSKQIPGAAAVWQTIDSLKSVYPYHLVVSAGDNFGGSYFYRATRGELLPVFFAGLGIDLSAVGNHEFDDGQKQLAAKWADSPLRPQSWNLEYVCANVRNGAGTVPAFASPFTTRIIPLSGGDKITIGFAGLLASSTPLQASASRLVGLSFDGNYVAVLDSVKHLPGYEQVASADVRLLLTHVGTTMSNGHPVWDDMDAANLSSLSDTTWHGILSSHTHQTVCGSINTNNYPVVQGKWHGEYISILKITFDTSLRKVVSVAPEVCRVNPDIPLQGAARRFQQQVDSFLIDTKTDGGTPIGKMLTTASRVMVHERDDKYCQTEVGELVCRSYAEAYRVAAHLSKREVIVGISHFGSIRAGFVKGPVSVLDVGEALPFSNKLRVFRLTGRQLRELVNFGLHNKAYGWIQTSWLGIERDAEGQVVRLSYVGPKGRKVTIADDTPCSIVADEFMTRGGDGYPEDFFSALQEVTAYDLPFTTDAFINYLGSFKTIGN